MTASQLIPDIPRIYTALAEWLSCLVFTVHLRRRYSPKQTGMLAAAFLLVQSVFLVVTDDVSLALWLPCMLLAVGLMLAFLYTCCQISCRDAFYFCTLAFVLAEFMAAAEWQLVCWSFPGELPNLFIRALLLVLVYAGITFCFYHLLRGQLPEHGQLAVRGKELISGVIIAAAVFTVSNIGFVGNTAATDGMSSYQLGIARMLVDGGGLAILFAHLMQCTELRMRSELDTMQTVLQNQYAQYMQSKESIELINYKYHDLKHQIAYLRSEQDSGKREAYLSRMEEEIRQYEAQNKTGNSVLDVVLTSKSLYCAKNGITFTCVADGTLLSFMDAVDICNIFGNALDNAIECEMKISDPEKRLIHVTVAQKKRFLILRFENYFEGTLSQKDGHFLTTKEKNGFHGYGIKSIRYIVEKYEGALTVETQGSWFEMKILIPIREEKENIE